jgi:hypothetical protein
MRAKQHRKLHALVAYRRAANWLEVGIAIIAFPGIFAAEICYRTRP